MSAPARPWTVEGAGGEREPRTYGLWVRPRSEGLFGMTWPVTVGVFITVVVALLCSAVFGVLAALVVVGLAAIVLVPMACRWGGRTGYEGGALMVQFARAWWRKETIYQAGAFSRLGSCRQPGLLARSRLYEYMASDGHPFAMIHIPKYHLYTVLLRCWPQGAAAVDQDNVDQWVACWGTLLASIGGKRDVEAITVVTDTMPETGSRLALEVAAQTKANAPQLARDTLAELAEILPSGKVRSESWLSVSFRATTPARRADPEEQALEIGCRLPGLISALVDAGVAARPMTGQEVTALARRAWDPAAEPALEYALTQGIPHGVDWSNAGPISATERRSHFKHEGVVSVTWEMDEAPKGTVNERVLQRLLEPNPQVLRKRIAIVYRPHSAGDATDIVTKDYRDALTGQNAARGVGSAMAPLRVAASEQAREEQARGHGVTRFSILITVTEPEGADMPSIAALTADLSVQAQLGIRRCIRFQAAAFAAGLGFGVLLPEMASMPRGMAE